MKGNRGEQETTLMAAAAEVIKEYLDWAEQAGAPNLSEIEEEVLRLRQRLGEQMAVVVLEGQAARQLVEGPRCAQCGGEMRYKGQKGNAVTSRIGCIRVARGYYHCAACQSGVFPPG